MSNGKKGSAEQTFSLFSPHSLSLSSSSVVWVVIREEARKLGGGAGRSRSEQDKVEESEWQGPKLSGAQMQLGHGFCNALGHALPPLAWCGAT